MALLKKHKSEGAKKEGNGYQDNRQPEIKALDSYLKESGSLPITQVCKILKDFYNVGNEYTANVWYQRILKLRSGEYKEATQKELEAIARLIHVERNKHLYGSIIHNLGQIERKTAQIEKYLQSGYQNRTETAKRIKELKTLNSLSITQISLNSE